MSIDLAREFRRDSAARYRPEHIKTLLVAEAPPAAEDRYFYFEDVSSGDFLFWETMKVIYHAQTRDAAKRHYLQRFKADGFFLIDALDVPVPPGASAAQLMVPRTTALIRLIRGLSPARIILVKATTFDALYRSLADSGLPVIRQRIPFPSSGRQLDFRNAFAAALQWDSRRQTAPARSAPVFASNKGPTSTAGSILPRKSLQDVANIIVQRMRTQGYAQGRLSRFGLVRKDPDGIVVSREHGQDTKLHMSEIREAVAAVRLDRSIYDRGPDALRPHIKRYVFSPLWALLRLATLEELLGEG